MSSWSSVRNGMTFARHSFDVESTGRGRGAVHISAIGEQAAGVDDRLGALFRDMRRFTRLDRVTLAKRLDTTVDLLMSLELGDVRALRPGPDLKSFVHRYAALVGIDPRPVYDRILASSSPLPTVQRQPSPAPLFGAGGHLTEAMAATAVPLPPAEARVSPQRDVTTPRRMHDVAQTMQPPSVLPARQAYPVTPAPQVQRGAASQTAPPRAVSSKAMAPPRKLRPKRRRQALFALSVPLVAVAFAAALLTLQPSTLLRAARALPPPASWVLRATGDAMISFRAKQHEGLKWIDLDDPAVRKSDKLRTKSP